MQVRSEPGDWLIGGTPDELGRQLSIGKPVLDSAGEI